MYVGGKEVFRCSSGESELILSRGDRRRRHPSTQGDEESGAERRSVGVEDVRDRGGMEGVGSCEEAEYRPVDGGDEECPRTDRS